MERVGGRLKRSRQDSVMKYLTVLDWPLPLDFGVGMKKLIVEDSEC